jgi:starch phosphorylase
MKDSRLNQRFKENLLLQGEGSGLHGVHRALSSAVMTHIAPRWQQDEAEMQKGRKACYLSAEFLVGRAVFNNLYCLGLLDEASQALESQGYDINSLEETEDAALGNGGLGRLAACYMDSAAAKGFPLRGYGIRYRYGLFRQSFRDGFQHERADSWQIQGDPWSVRRDDLSQIVEFSGRAGQKLRAVPYDMPIVAGEGGKIRTLRLWQAEPLEEFDFDLFNRQKYDAAVRGKNRAEDISRTLYPNDDGPAGKRLRLKQQYFFCSASIADMIREYKLLNEGLERFAGLHSVQLNDTHPVIAIPELIRRLVGEGLSFDEAFEIAAKVFNYTNHTIMSEAFEKWSLRLLASLLPDIMGIIRLIQRRLERELSEKGIAGQRMQNMSIISDGSVNMAHMALFVCRKTNGVARIHTGILKEKVLKEWHEAYPGRFVNVTNGITQRRWFGLCNPALARLASELTGADCLKEPQRLSDMARFAQDKGALDRFTAIKEANKDRLAGYIKEREGISIDPRSIFDIQIKRMHEYKRQLMNAFEILMLYQGIKDGEIKGLHPTTFIFGAKAAPGYFRAKGIIKYINELARMINADKSISDIIKIVFVQNYNVSYAEKLVVAADVSQQISMAGTEASGTGNMKFMLNGTVTLGTYDGANVEIVQAAGIENNYIFGARVEELTEIMPSYDPLALYKSDPRIKMVIDSLAGGPLSDGGSGMFAELHGALMKGASWHRPDHYYVLGDLLDYHKTRLLSNSDFTDRYAFAQKSFLNMCGAGGFSSDRSVAAYAKEIWNI